MKNKITYLDFNNPLINEEQVATANLGALYIVSALEKAGYGVDYRDYQISSFAHSLKVEDIVTFAEDSGEILLICCMAYMLPLVTLALDDIKSNSPTKKIILGGVGPTGVAKELSEAFHTIDIIIKGEGEKAIVEVIQALQLSKQQQDEALIKVEGIVFKNTNKEVVVTKERSRNRILDEIDFPAYHHIDIRKYEEFGLITGRGCAYKCKFCDIHGLWGDEYLQRSLDNVMLELNILVKEYGVKQIKIWDDTFTMSNKRIIEFCKRLKQENLKFEWTCFGRVNLVNEELLNTMAQAGCTGMFYGLESGSERILKAIDKKITVHTMIEAIEMTKKYMYVKGHLIWGFPFETCEDLYQTIYLYNYLKEIMEINIGQLWAYPTSPLYREYKDMIKFDSKIDMFYKILPFKEEEAMDQRRVMQLIMAHKEIFTQFYYYHTENFFERYNMIKRLERIC